MRGIAYCDEVLKPHPSSMVSTPPKHTQSPFRVDAGKPVAWKRNPFDSRIVRMDRVGFASAVTN